MPENTSHTDALPPPELIAPVERQPVEPGPITFQWKPVEGAEGYEIQVARDRNFEDIALSIAVEPATRRTVRGPFEDVENEGFYWRMRTEHDDHFGTFGPPAQFIVATPEMLEAMAAVASRPDAEEDYGPVAELFRAASLEVRAEVTGSQDYRDQEEEMGVEHEGIEASQILALTVVTIVIIGMLVAVVFQLYGSTTANLRSDVAATANYPELRETRAQAQRLLTQFEAVEGEDDVFRIPIDRAIDLMAREAETAEDTTLAFPSDEPASP